MLPTLGCPSSLSRRASASKTYRSRPEACVLRQRSINSSICTDWSPTVHVRKPESLGQQPAGLRPLTKIVRGSGATCAQDSLTDTGPHPGSCARTVPQPSTPDHRETCRSVDRRPAVGGWLPWPVVAARSGCATFFVTELLRSGVLAAVVQRLARHGDLATTQRYADVDATRLRGAIEQLDGKGARARTGTPRY